MPVLIPTTTLSLANSAAACKHHVLRTKEIFRNNKFLSQMVTYILHFWAILISHRKPKNFPSCCNNFYLLEPIACFPPSSSLPCALKSYKERYPPEQHSILFVPVSISRIPIFLHGRSMAGMMDLQKYICKFFLMEVSLLSRVVEKVYATC